MSYWVGVDDNLNNGWPKVINAISKPVQYLRVLGPYDTEDDATDAAFNYPDVTAGWRAVCQFYTAPGKGNTIHLDYPPNGQQYPVFYGPYEPKPIPLLVNTSQHLRSTSAQVNLSIQFHQHFVVV